MNIKISLLTMMFLGVFSLSLTPLELDDALPAFPGAEGFGSKTPGGRYGKVMFVTNLEDTVDPNSPDYTGSLRWALEHTWPDDPDSPYDQRRIVIFRVGGTITLEDELLLKHPYVTVAGQTAPGDGIMLRGDQLTIATHDVIVRNLRVRVGDEGTPTCCRDGVNIGTHKADSDVYNIVVDHSSISWSIDENLSTWTSSDKSYSIHDITVQWSIISEALHDSIHVDEGATETAPHSMGMILGRDGYNISVHHNLFVNNWGRNPRVSGMVNSEIINNVVYGWENKGIELSGDQNNTHIINNYFIRTSDSQGPEISLSKSMNPESRVYIEGNLTDDVGSFKELKESVVSKDESILLSSGYVFEPSGISILSGIDAYDELLALSGAISPTRDKVDQRVVDNVIHHQGQIIDSQSQVGGWPEFRSGVSPMDTDSDGIPDEWELEHGLDIYSANDANNPFVLAPSGYTWLEEYVNSLLFPPDYLGQEPSKLPEWLIYFAVVLFVLFGFGIRKIIVQLMKSSRET